MMHELENLKERVDLAGFKRERDRLIGYLYNNGATFLGITMNFPEFWKKNYSKERALKDTLNEIKYSFLGCDMFKIDLLEFVSITVEYHNKDKEAIWHGYPHLHILLCFRNLVKFEHRMINQILDHIVEEDDIRVDYLKDFKEISNFWTFATKTILFEQDLPRFYLTHFRQDSFLYGKMGDFLDIQSCTFSAYSGGSIEKHKDFFIEGLNFNKIKSEETILINLLKIFMNEQNIFLDRNFLYQKIFNSRFSYKKIGDLRSLPFLMEDILKILTERFPIQLDRKDIQYLIIEQLEPALRKIELFPFLLPNREVLSGLLEFKDGLYDLKSNDFLKIGGAKYNEIFQELEENGSCIQFFNRNYKGLGKPSFLLSVLKKKFNVESEIERFCIAFGQLIHSNLESTSAEQSINVAKKENLTSNDYLFSRILDICLGLIIEFESKNKQNLNNLARLVQQSSNKKNRSKDKDSYLSFASISNQINFLLENDLFLTQLVIRLLSQNNSKIVDEVLLNKIRVELPKIVVYCNRLYFNKILKTSIDKTK